MAEAKSVKVIAAIEAALADIQTSNGYLTDAGKYIHKGFLSYAMQATDKLKTPCILIQVNSESLATNGTLNGKVTLDLNLFAIDKADKPEDLQAVVSDIRRALVKYEESKTIERHTMGVNQYGTAAYNPEPDSSFAFAALPVGVNFMEKY